MGFRGVGEFGSVQGFQRFWLRCNLATEGRPVEFRLRLWPELLEFLGCLLWLGVVIVGLPSLVKAGAPVMFSIFLFVSNASSCLLFSSLLVPLLFLFWLPLY